MPPFPKPTVEYAYQLPLEKRRLRAHRKKRGMPRKGAGRLLVGSWNIANPSTTPSTSLRAMAQDMLRAPAAAGDRPPADRRAVELVQRLSRPSEASGGMIAVQECRENPSTALRTCFADPSTTLRACLYAVLHYMGPKYQALMSAAGGNNERLVFVYDRKKLNLLDEIGEVSIAPSRAKSVKLDDESEHFVGFDRPPYLASFNLTGTPLSVQLVNVHLFFGSPSPVDVARRALEACPERSEGSRIAVERSLALPARGSFDSLRSLRTCFNMPKPRRDGGNVVHDALTSRGLVTPGHSTVVGSSIASDNQYDQACPERA